MMTPEQHDAAWTSIDNAYRSGQITRKQRDAAREALDTANDVGDWASLIYMGGAVLVSVLTGVPIAVGAVQRKRGPVATPDERVRRAAAKV
jgi:hypothetical protein